MNAIRLLPFLAISVVLIGLPSAGMVANADDVKDNTGVLVYTHGIPTDPLAHKPASDRITAIENHLEEQLDITSEKITHMPYWWNNGLLSLDKSEKDYAIFLYTDMFGPNSTVIHDLSRGYFAGIDGYTCPPFPYSLGPPLNTMPAIIDAELMATPFPGQAILAPMFQAMRVDIGHMLEQYGNVCWFMGHIHVQVETYSDSKIILAEPARPDHPILREIFVKQADAVSESPEDEILVLVGHGARNDSHNAAQDAELSCAAEYVENRLGFADSTALIVREDWVHLSEPAIAAGKQEILDLLSTSGANHVTLAHATGTLEGLSLATDMLDEEGISYTVTPNADLFSAEEIVMWAEQTVQETIDFIEDERPTESTTTPYWDRTYTCEAESDQTSVTGTVFSDDNGNGVQDAGEQGIGGHRMLAIDYSTLEVRDTYTAADGTYALRIQPAPAMTLVQTAAYPEGFAPSTVWFIYIMPEEGTTTTFDIGFSPES